ELLQVAVPGSAAGAALRPDDSLHHLYMAEAPDGELLVHVHQLLAHLVGIPVALRIVVDLLEDRDEPGMPRRRRGDVALQHLARNQKAASGQMAEELVVERRRAQRRLEM